MKVLERIAKITRREPVIAFKGARLGDQQETKSVAQKASKSLGFAPKVSLNEGLVRRRWVIKTIEYNSPQVLGKL